MLTAENYEQEILIIPLGNVDYRMVAIISFFFFIIKDNGNKIVRIFSPIYHASDSKYCLEKFVVNSIHKSIHIQSGKTW